MGGDTIGGEGGGCGGPGTGLIYTYIYIFPTANLLGFNLWGRGLVTRVFARPEKTEQSWNLAGTFRCWVAKLG